MKTQWKIFLVLFFFGCVDTHVFSIASENLFAKYPNRFFVETGSHTGYGITLALKAGFSEIRSIELSENFYNMCLLKFKKHHNIKLYLGDSSMLLLEMISDINEPITFWLDGHYSGGKTSKGEKYSPIVEELEQIALHPIKNHTIIIDDVRLMGGMYFDFVSLDQIKKIILSINPAYQFVLHDGYVDNDILVAYIQ